MTNGKFPKELSQLSLGQVVGKGVRKRLQNEQHLFFLAIDMRDSVRKVIDVQVKYDSAEKSVTRNKPTC